MDNLAFFIFWMGLIGFIYNLLTALQSIAAVHWPVAEGQLDEVELDCDHVDPEGVVYEPKVSYTYQVGLNSYHSTKFAFGILATTFRFEDAQVIRTIIERDPLLVYYHPRNPKKAVLLTGIRMHHILQGLCFTIVTLVAGSFL